MKLENAKESITVINADISGSNFDNVRATDFTMNNINLAGMNISDANMTEVNIDGAQWGGGRFRYIGYGNKSQPEVEFNKEPVQFTCCNLEQGLFSECNFTNVKLDNCNISGLVINGVDIEAIINKNASGDRK